MLRAAGRGGQRPPDERQQSISVTELENRSPSRISALAFLR